jgi:outer membrane lipoprotein-sorting protein
MTKKIFFVLSVLFFILNSATAQSDAQAEKIISDLLNSVKTNAIKTDFTLTISDKSNPSGQVVSGTFTLKASMFVLDMTEMKAWFDGKTQWAYIPQNKEVSITEPTENELSETNPMAILSGYKAKSIIRFSKTKSDQNYCIEMIPKAKSTDISKIEVQVNKNTQNLFLIKLTNKNGSTSLLTLSNFQKGIKVQDSFFVFNPSNFKGVIENDLR